VTFENVALPADGWLHLPGYCESLGAGEAQKIDTPVSHDAGILAVFMPILGFIHLFVFEPDRGAGERGRRPQSTFQTH